MRANGNHWESCLTDADLVPGKEKGEGRQRGRADLRTV